MRKILIIQLLLLNNIFTLAQIPYTHTHCNEIYNEIRISTEGVSEWDGLNIIISPDTVLCLVELPYNSDAENYFHDYLNNTFYKVIESKLSDDEENYIRFVVDSFFVYQTVSIYSIRRKLYNGRYIHDASLNYLSFNIETSNRTDNIEIHLASAFRVMPTQIEDYEIKYNYPFMFFLQYLYYLRAKMLGGKYYEVYLNEIKKMSNNSEYMVFKVWEKKFIDGIVAQNEYYSD